VRVSGLQGLSSKGEDSSGRPPGLGLDPNDLPWVVNGLDKSRPRVSLRNSRVETK